MNRKASRYTSFLSVGFLVLATLSAAQEYSYESGYIRAIEGDVSLQSAQNPEPEPGEVNLPVLPGDRLWTASSSFAEIRLADGTIVRVGEATKVDFIAFGAEPNILLWSGSIIVKAGVESALLRVDTPSGSAYQRAAGTYRVDVADGAATTVSVIDGVAELGSETSSVLVYAGQRSSLEPGGTPQEPLLFDTTASDELDVWRRTHDREAPRRRSVPVADVAPEIHHYVEDLSDYGTWSEDETHGAVWYPTSVGYDWAPYRNGRWCYTSYGYTWVSHEPWGWAPSHYGRWGYNHVGWYWVPGRHFSPAWVSIAVGPTWIGWSPLGHRGGSVFSYSHGFYGSGRYPSHKGRPYYRGGRAVPRHVYDHGAGWNFSRKDRFGYRGKARLRASEVRSTSGRARLHSQGAVLDRTMTAHATGTRSERAPRGPSATPFARNGRLRAAGRARGRAATASSRLNPTTDAKDRSTERALGSTRNASRARGSSATRAREDNRAGTLGAIGPRSGSRVFRAPGTAAATGTRGRTRNDSSATRERNAPARRDPTQSRTRSRARTSGDGNTQAAQPRTRGQESFERSSRREAVRRSPSSSRQRTTTRGGITTQRGRTRSPSANRTQPRSQRNATGGSRTRTRNRSGVTRTPPQSRPSGIVSGPRGSSRTLPSSSRGGARVGGSRGGSNRGSGARGSGSRGGGNRGSGGRGRGRN